MLPARLPWALAGPAGPQGPLHPLPPALLLHPALPPPQPPPLRPAPRHHQLLLQGQGQQTLPPPPLLGRCQLAQPGPAQRTATPPDCSPFQTVQTPMLQAAAHPRWRCSHCRCYCYCWPLQHRPRGRLLSCRPRCPHPRQQVPAGTGAAPRLLPAGAGRGGSRRRSLQPQQRGRKGPGGRGGEGVGWGADVARRGAAGLLNERLLPAWRRDYARMPR